MRIEDIAHSIEVERSIYADEYQRKERDKQDHKDLICLAVNE
jgi:hypothetical protein